MVDGKVNWSAIRHKIKVRIFSKGKDNAPKDNVRVQYGVPYLIIEDPRQASKVDTAESKSMYIRLQPARFSKSSRYYAPLRELMEQILYLEGVLEESLGDATFNEAIRQYAHDNFHIVDSTNLNARGSFHEATVTKNDVANLISDYFNTEKLSEEDIIEVTKALDRVIELTHGAEERTLFLDDEQEAKDAVGTTIQGKKIIDYDEKVLANGNIKYVLLYQSDINSDEAKVFKKNVLSSRGGAATKALNALAKANEYLGGEQIRVKLRSRAGDQYTITRSKSILSTDNAIDWVSFYEDLGPQLEITEQDVMSKVGEDKNAASIYLTNYILKHRRGLKVNTIEGPITIVDQDSVAELIDAYTTKPISSLMLQLIVGNVAFDESGKHYTFAGTDSKQGLREPLHMDMINFMGGTSVKSANPNAMDEDARKELSKLLSSSFIGMQKTSLLLELVESDVIDQPKPKRDTLGAVLDTIKSTGTKYLDDLVEMLRSSEVIRTVPLEFADTVESSKNLLATYYDPITGTTRVVSSLHFDNINNDTQLLSVFLHETIHAATLGSIRRVKAKKGNEADVKLYKALVAIQRRFNAYVNFNKEKLGIPNGVKDVYQKTKNDKFGVEEFVANLSNPKFYNIARTKTLSDMLIDILKAIVEFLGFSKDTSLYDATVIVLRKHLDAINASGGYITNVIEEEDIKKDITKLKANLIPVIKAKISVLSKRISDLEEQDEDASHLYSELRSVNEDLKTVSEESNLTSLSNLNIIRAIASKYNVSDEFASYAYYTPDEIITSASTGSMLVTSGVKDFVSETFVTSSNKVSFLLRSLIQNQLLDPTDNYIKQIINTYDSGSDLDTLEKLLNVYLFDVLNWNERKKLRKEYAVSKDIDLINLLITQGIENQFVADVLEVTRLLKENEDKLQFLIADTIDKNTDRYIQAKRFILEELRNNSIGVEGIVRTKIEALKATLDKVSPIDKSTPAPYITELEIELEQHKLRAKELVTNLKSNAAKEEYHVLISSTIPNAENKLFALKALATKNTRTGKTLFLDILADIYPKSNLDTSEALEIITEDLEYTINDRGEREAKSSSGITEYIKDYSKSMELTLSESMKDFLSYIPVEDKPGTYLNSGLAYVKLMQLVTSLDWNGDIGTHIVNQLSDRMRNKVLSSIDKTITRALYDLITSALTTQDLSNFSALANNVSIVTTTNDVGRVMYAAIFSPNRTDISRLTYNEALSTSGVQVSALTNDSASLYNWLRTKTNLNVSIYNTLYRRAEATNALREIMNAMASMQEMELYITTRSNSSGTKFANIRSKESGVSFGIKNDIITKLRDLHNDDKLRTFKTEFVASNKKA